jgi:hypothetical protein
MIELEFFLAKCKNLSFNHDLGSYGNYYPIKNAYRIWN